MGDHLAELRSLIPTHLGAVEVFGDRLATLTCRAFYSVVNRFGVAKSWRCSAALVLPLVPSPSRFSSEQPWVRRSDLDRTLTINIASRGDVSTVRGHVRGQTPVVTGPSPSKLARKRPRPREWNRRRQAAFKTPRPPQRPRPQPIQGPPTAAGLFTRHSNRG
jgi:hypothetical protein